MTLVAALQMTSGNRVEANLEQAERLIAEAAERGARLAVLPENFALMAGSDAERRAAAEPDGQGPIQDFLAAMARRHGLWLVGGTIPLQTPGEKVYAACLLYDARGERVARYDKIHLFDVELGNGERYYESNGIEAGRSPVVARTPFGNIGLSVCYDVRFPELYRRLIDLGAEILVVPSAFTAYTGRAHWETLVRARAIENSVYVVAAAQTGRHPNGRETHGDSMIVGPWGEVIARLPQGSGVVLAECELEQVRRVRRQLPSIEHRRFR
ncbi:MAG TPA: carbon-nitrogen hydrolase family protein [Burkholderiales bacterium]